MGSLDEHEVGLEGVPAGPAATTYHRRRFGRRRPSKAARDPAGAEPTLRPAVYPAGDGQLQVSKVRPSRWSAPSRVTELRARPSGWSAAFPRRRSGPFRRVPHGSGRPREVRLSRRSVRRASDAYRSTPPASASRAGQLVPEDIEDLLHVVHPGGGRDDEVRLGDDDAELAVGAVAAEPVSGQPVLVPVPLPPVDGAVRVVVVVDVLPGRATQPSGRMRCCSTGRPAAAAARSARRTRSAGGAR